MPKESFVDGWVMGKILWYVDTGFQKYMYKGQEAFSRKVSLTFELDHLMSDGRPFVYTQEYTFSNKRKTQSPRDFCTFIENLTGESMETENEINSFEFENLPGTSIAMNFETVLYTRKDGTKTTYQNMVEYRKPKNGKEYTFESENEHIFFNTMNVDIDEYKKIPNWLRNKIRSSTSFERIPDHLQEEMIAFDDSKNTYAKAGDNGKKLADSKKVPKPEKNQHEVEESVFSEEDSHDFDDEIPF